MNIFDGDLNAIPHGILLHQVNCLGKTGYLAGALRRSHRAAFNAYFQAIMDGRRGARLLGRGVIGGQLPVLVGHVFGQFQIGPHTDMAAVESGLSEIRMALGGNPEWVEVPVFAPYKMGCGKGGGDWEAYSALLCRIFPDVTIVRHPVYS